MSKDVEAIRSCALEQEQSILASASSEGNSLKDQLVWNGLSIVDLITDGASKAVAPFSESMMANAFREFARKIRAAKDATWKTMTITLTAS